MSPLLFNIARDRKSPFIIIALLWMLHGAVLGAIGITFDAPQDDRKVRQSVQDRPELKLVATELNNLIETRIWPLKADEVDQFFGPKLAVRPQNLVLPIFSSDGVLMSGLSPDGTDGKRHQEMHAVGNIGYVEFYCNWDGSPATGVFYHRADSKFVPLRSEADFSRRLEWDTAQFRRIRGWLDEHLPKMTYLGEVVVADHTPSRIHVGNGKDYLVTAMVDSESNYSVQLMVDSQKESEKENSVFYRNIDHPGEPIGFSVDGHFFCLTPKLKSPPTKKDLGAVKLSENTLTPLDVGAGRECIASLRGPPNASKSIYLAVKCKSYSQGITEPIPPPGDSISFAIDGNIVSFTPEVSGK